MQYQDSWKDQDVFWNSLKDMPCLRGHKLPAKSDPRAWRMALAEPAGPSPGNNKESAVILTATMHTLPARWGAPMRLQMHPLKREQSSRLYRRFGYDRFLEVQVPSVDSWPNPTREPLCQVEAVAARWLAGKAHEFMGRHWAAFYVRDRQLKVETSCGQNGVDSTKTVFYDRVLFFAERGTGLVDWEQPSLRSSCPLRENDLEASIRACSRNNMLDWLLNWKENGKQSYLKLFHRVTLGKPFFVFVSILTR